MKGTRPAAYASYVDRMRARTTGPPPCAAIASWTRAPQQLPGARPSHAQAILLPLGFAQVDQPVANGERRRFQTGVHLELGEDALHVGANRVLADPQSRGGDPAVCPARKQSEDLTLAGSQLRGEEGQLLLALRNPIGAGQAERPAR